MVDGDTQIIVVGADRHRLLHDFDGAHGVQLAFGLRRVNFADAVVDGPFLGELKAK